MNVEKKYALKQELIRPAIRKLPMAYGPLGQPPSVRENGRLGQPPSGRENGRLSHPSPTSPQLPGAIRGPWYVHKNVTVPTCPPGAQTRR